MVHLRPAERRLVARLDAPRKVQRWLAEIDYNHERGGGTLRSFHGVLRHKSAHCLEGALAAAFVLERHGYPPLVLDLESEDALDHVVFVFRGPRGWGAVGKSKYPALMGRAPIFRSLRDLAWSYVDPFVDRTGRVTGWAVYDLRDAPPPDWRRARGNVWRVERALLDHPHAPMRASDARHARAKRRYLAWKARHPDREPPASFYADAARMWP
ncbi:MAG TPA: hypothetical protein VHH36_06995 [Candidatus Thermoplasmatota archaeon]|nr:hypothetical protein [Candidatus Thermoplasmatota archaeon]